MAKNPGGQSKFNEKVRAALIEMAKAGDIVEEMAEKIGVSRKTIYNWMESDPEFAEEIDCARAISDKGPEVSLRQRAIGYEYKSEKIFFNQRTGEVVRAPIIIHVPPDVTAQIYWLKNRQPKRWRDKQPGEDDKTVKHTGEVQINKMDIQERVALIKGKK